ncbi:MAG TPA: alpha/beta hydrolase-fold protein, partial [Planctomycetota bacterium]|nr:alpha/beta hydrolase-fold protein [Planctomycetota bacterium]
RLVGDIPGRAKIEKGENGVWEAVVGPLEPGPYRYRFDVDGVAVVDPRNPSTSESNGNAWSLVYVPGADFMDLKSEVPHGAVAEVTYYSRSLERFRRMHVYTPPGYESGTESYPVLYLLHGASDSDDSWSTIGRAGVILDNLIASGKARPMLIVMPAGHTGPFSFGGRARGSADLGARGFADDFVEDILPHVEKTYRVSKERRHRAIAGLSMGGAQTLEIGIPHLERFAYLGVFSSGIFELNRRRGDDSNGEGDRPSWEDRNRDALSNAELKKGLELVWFATGVDDFLLGTSRATVELLKKHGFDVKYEETSGGHTWDNWRKYLRDFAPLLFQEKTEPAK